MIARWEGQDLILEIYCQPNAKQNTFLGLHGDHIKIKIAAPALDNQANIQAQNWLAKEFNITKKDVTLLHGKQSRYKVFRIHQPQQIPEWINPFV